MAEIPQEPENLMHLDAELRIWIEDQVLVLDGFRKCLAKLLHGPFTGRVLGRIEVDDLDGYGGSETSRIES
jgi:hypothetical protein